MRVVHPRLLLQDFRQHLRAASPRSMPCGGRYTGSCANAQLREGKDGSARLKAARAVGNGMAHGAAEARAGGLLDAALPHEPPLMLLQLRLLLEGNGVGVIRLAFVNT